MRSVSASSTRIGQTLDLFFGSDSGEQAMAANAYKRAVEELEGSTATTIVGFRREMDAVWRAPGCEADCVCGVARQDAPYRATVLGPIGKLTSYWPEINAAITKRQKKVRRPGASR